MRFWLSTVLAARFTLAIFAAALALGVDASAHHSTAFFDGNKTWAWMPPHTTALRSSTGTRL